MNRMYDFTQNLYTIATRIVKQVKLILITIIMITRTYFLRLVIV